MTWTGGNRDQIPEVLELRVAEFAGKHIHSKSSIDGSSYHHVRWYSIHSFRSHYPHFIGAETEAQRGHWTCPRTHSQSGFKNGVSLLGWLFQGL